ncbi:MAG: phage tail sheath subtilisin-like domain-containing protein [Saprospiraceae bacterium]
MASTFKTPGVYIQEIRKFPPSVAAVATAIPAFIGHTQKAKEKEDDDLRNRPRKIRSLLQYEAWYGGPPVEPAGAISVTIEIPDDGPPAANAKINETLRSKFLMHSALQAFFANGGGECFIVSVGDYSAANIDVNLLLAGLDQVAKEDEVTLIVFPEAIYVGSAADHKALNDQALIQCNELQDRFAIMDVYGQTGNIDDDANNFRNNGVGTNHLKYGAVYYPLIETIFDYTFDETLVNVSVIEASATNDTTMDQLPSAQKTQAQTAIQLIPLILPPSAIMAGVYASVDENRGVWKAPANVSLANVIKPTVKISHKEQENLNVDVNAGKSINAIRTFLGKGTLVWGARTLAGNDNEWRYVPVRRFFNMVEESVKKASAQFVFEPNDANTWIKIKSMIENFLVLQWRAGALAGAVPEDAFFVKVGLNETMTALDILEGRLIVEIGMAAVRPAEFIILRFSHKMQES